MSVLIKGMEMPYNCWDCSLLNASSCPCKNYSSALEYTTNRHPNCPLIEIPEPHGRLGDLDALPWYLANTSVKYATYEDWEMLCDAIAAAPTVIPASEEGE